MFQAILLWTSRCYFREQTSFCKTSLRRDGEPSRCAHAWIERFSCHGLLDALAALDYASPVPSPPIEARSSSCKSGSRFEPLSSNRSNFRQTSRQLNLNRNRNNPSPSQSRRRYEHPGLYRSNNWVPRLAMELHGMEPALHSAEVTQ
jgi:hypothetical protein